MSARRTDGGPRLSANDEKVLRFLADQSVDFGVYPFDPLAEQTGLSRREVRLSCRKLARKGLTEFHRGCWTDDGEPAGSGYDATTAGRDLIRARTTLDSIADDAGRT